MSNTVKPGQVWSFIDSLSTRARFHVTHVDRDRVRGTIGGKERSFALSVLAEGHRAARLEQEADGHKAFRPRAGVGTQTAEELMTASDYKRDYAPRGISSATPKMQEALRMQRHERKTLAQIAKHFGVTPSTASNWVTRAREQEEDEASLAAVGRSAGMT